MIYIGDLILTSSKVIITDPCYIGQNVAEPIKALDLKEYGWDAGTYRVFFEEGRMLVIKDSYRSPDRYSDRYYKKISTTPVDSGQICIADLSIEENWNSDNGNLSDLIDTPWLMLSPTTDYASCCMATLNPPCAGLSPMHKKKLDEGLVVVFGTKHGDGRYPIFISDRSDFLLIETGDPNYDNDFFEEEEDDDEYFEDYYEDESLMSDIEIDNPFD